MAGWKGNERDVLCCEELLEESLDEAEAEADPAQVPGMAALLLDAVVLHVLVEDVVERGVLLGRPDEVVHLDGSRGELGLSFFLSWLRRDQSTRE